jgi:hypothetical protein
VIEVGASPSEEASGKNGKKESNRSFSTYRWQWWVIYPNSTKLGFGGVPLEALHKNHGVGGCSTVFLSRSTVELLELVVFG